MLQTYMPNISLYRDKRNGFLMFCVLFDVSINGIPSIISARKLAFLYLLLEYGMQRRRGKISQYDRSRTLLFAAIVCLILLYVVFISFLYGVLTHENSIIPRLVYFILYAIVTPVFLASRYSFVEDFMRDVIAALWIQSIATLALFFSPSLSEIAEQYIPHGNVDYLRTDRAAGLGAEAGYLTLLLFLGFFYSQYLYEMKERRLFHRVSQILFIGTMFIVGRTGLYISVIFILYSIYVNMKTKRTHPKAIRTLLGVLIAGAVLLTVFSSVLTQEQYFRLYYRLTGILNKDTDDSSVSALMAMKIPKLTSEFLLGTGIYRGKTAIGTSIQNDSGYVQMYAALGLFSAIVFYVALFVYMVSALRHDIRKKQNPLLHHFLLFLILTLFVVEIKEPFILKYVLVMNIVTNICISGKGGRIVYYD